MPVRVLNEFEWARIIAKAYLDGTTGDLEKDPKSFVDGVRATNDPPGMFLPDHVRLLDYYSMSSDSVAVTLRAIFQGSDARQLQDLFLTGNFLGQPVEMPPSEWITDTGLTRLFLHGDAEISPRDWMRIYAYVWYQVKYQNNQTILEDFEVDPARALQDPTRVFNDEIIANINQVSVPALNIAYTYRQTPLFSLGAPPPPGTLTDIRHNQKAMGYRHRLRKTC